MTTTHTFTTPVGRFVGGDLFTPNAKGFDGKPLVSQSGEPRSEYVLKVAFPKSDPGTEEIRREIFAAAQEGFPSLFPNGQPSLPTFSYKWTDGDSTVPNSRGTKPCDREGYPGHWVISFKSSFAPQIYDQQVQPIVDPKAIKRGDYVRVAATCKANGQQTKPGVYVNHSMVQLMGYGQAIQSGPDASVAFAAPAQLPPGASQTPVAPTTGMPAMPGGAPAAPAPAPAAPAPAPAAPAPAAPAPAPAPTPAPGFGAAPVAPAPPPPAAPAAPGRQMLPTCPHTYEALAAQGWTDEQMRAQGWLA